MVFNSPVTFRFTPKNQAITRNDIITRNHTVQPLESVKMLNHPEQNHTPLRSLTNPHHGPHPAATALHLKLELPSLFPGNLRGLLAAFPGKAGDAHSVTSSFEGVDATRIMGPAWPLNKGDLSSTTIRDNKQYPKLIRALQPGALSITSEITFLNHSSCTDLFTGNLTPVELAIYTYYSKNRQAKQTQLDSSAERDKQLKYEI